MSEHHGAPPLATDAGGPVAGARLVLELKRTLKTMTERIESDEAVAGHISAELRTVAAILENAITALVRRQLEHDAPDGYTDDELIKMLDSAQMRARRAANMSDRTR